MAVHDPSTPKMEASLPESAVLLALIYQRLGGTFSISSKGGRYFGRPEPALFHINGGDIPQLPGAKAHEQFRNAEQWKGAVKLVEALLQRLDERDTDTIFDLFAAVAVDDRTFRPSIEDPRRPQ
jgi:hypothetical protein